MGMRAPLKVQGSLVALATPFKAGGLDEQAFADLVEWQIAEGTDGLVPVGTTGESPTLTPEEHVRVVRLCVEAARGRVPVIAGTGSNATAEAVHFSREAEEAGADGLLIVTPYYNKPTQEGLYQHFRTVAGATGLPIIVYNIPARSIVDLGIETLQRLAAIPTIVGIKDATANLQRMSEQRLALGSDFLQFSGEDATALAFMAHGGHGCISVTANVAPRACAGFQRACLAGNFKEALALQDRLFPLHQALFLETSPSPVKYALSVLGRCAETVRLPLVAPGEATRARVRAAMVGAGLVSG